MIMMKKKNRLYEDYIAYLEELEQVTDWKSYLTPSEITVAKKLYPEEEFKDNIIFTCRYCKHENKYTTRVCTNCGKQNKY